jgi:hypothetical protein
VIALNDFDLKITEVRTSHAEIRAKVGPLPADLGKKGYRVSLFFGPAFGARDFMEKVTVFTNSRRDPNLTIDVIGSVREAVLVVPERLYFPMLAPGQELSRRVYVYRTDGRPLRLTGVEDPSGLFTSEMKQVEPARWEVTVKVHGEAPAETVRGAFLIGTDDPSEPKVSLPFELPGGRK